MAGALQARRHAAHHLAATGSSSSRPAREEVERGGRRVRITRVWTPGRPTLLELTVDTVTEVLTVWPFTVDELLDELRDAGLEPQDSTYTSEAERYLVASSRD